jgi:hypothetical protein
MDEIAGTPYLNQDHLKTEEKVDTSSRLAQNQQYSEPKTK